MNKYIEQAIVEVTNTDDPEKFATMNLTASLIAYRVYELMTKDAVDGEVIAPCGTKCVEHAAVVCAGKMATPFPPDVLRKFEVGDRVKLIIIKEG